ncbi:unnamed protein product [Meganyctiphanes norvegica]|uniref:Uncharacterized protein n=1 Tax=Meganyctiphanes norvegica TaxID=48144 RepID=A0AAV2QKJ4_MEGNR
MTTRKCRRCEKCFQENSEEKSLLCSDCDKYSIGDIKTVAGCTTNGNESESFPNSIGFKTTLHNVGENTERQEELGDKIENVIPEEDEDVNCGACSCLVEDNGEGLYCEICCTWYHNACVHSPLPRDVYDELGEAPDNVKWLCDRCREDTIVRVKLKLKGLNRHKNNYNTDSGFGISRAGDHDEYTTRQANDNDFLQKGRTRTKNTKLGSDTTVNNDAKGNSISKRRGITDRGRCRLRGKGARGSYKKKIRNPDKYRCKEEGCDFRANVPSVLKYHMLAHTDKNSFQCEVCGKNFSSPGNLKSHNVIHMEVKPFKCSKCDKCFNTKSHLDRHSWYHKSERPYTCNKCNKGFVTKQAFVRHEAIHQNEKPFACTECDYKCNFERNLKQHMLTHSAETPYECENCEKKFKTSWYLKMHIQTHSGEKRFPCDVCGKKLASNSRLKYHMLSHSDKKQYNCSECEYKCNLRSLLKTHSYKHTGEKPYECNICPLKFISKQSLETHLRIHTGERPYECDTCGKRFGQAASLHTHKLTHTDSKPFQCEVCGAGFKRSHHLKVHMFSHTGEKQFSCEQCSKAFVTKDKLNQHIQTHSGVKPFECKICSNKYTNKGNLTKHKCRGPNTPQSEANQICNFNTLQYTNIIENSNPSNRNQLEQLNLNLEFEEKPPSLVKRVNINQTEYIISPCSLANKNNSFQTSTPLVNQNHEGNDLQYASAKYNVSTSNIEASIHNVPSSTISHPNLPFNVLTSYSNLAIAPSTISPAVINTNTTLLSIPSVNPKPSSNSSTAITHLLPGTTISLQTLPNVGVGNHGLPSILSCPSIHIPNEDPTFDWNC